MIDLQATKVPAVAVLPKVTNGKQSFMALKMRAKTSNHP
jgi:hypothetical protein